MGKIDNIFLNNNQGDPPPDNGKPSKSNKKSINLEVPYYPKSRQDAEIYVQQNPSLFKNKSTMDELREKLYLTIAPSLYPSEQGKKAVSNLFTGTQRVKSLKEMNNLFKEYINLKNQYEAAEKEKDEKKKNAKTNEEYKKLSYDFYNSDLFEKYNRTREKFYEITDGYEIKDEDMWRMYLGIPQINNTVIESKYKPTPDDNEKYYTTIKTNEDRKNLIKMFSQGPSEELKDPNDHHVGELEYLNFPIKAMPKTFVGIYESGYAHVTYSKGEDENGKFISIYDVYDFDIPGEKVVGNPYSLYDKVYYKEDESGYPVLDEDFYNNQDKLETTKKVNKTTP